MQRVPELPAQMSARKSKDLLIADLPIERPPSHPCRHNARVRDQDTTLLHLQSSHLSSLHPTSFVHSALLQGPSASHSQMALPPASRTDSGPPPSLLLTFTPSLFTLPEQGNGTGTAVLRTRPGLQLAISPIGSRTAKLLNNGHAFIRAAHCELM